MPPHCRFSLALGGAVVAAALLVPSAAWCQSTAAAEPPEETAELRASLAEEIVAAREQGSGRAFDPEFRLKMAQSLRSLPIDSLEAAARGQDVSQALQTALAFQQSKLVYTPLNPCRLMDTRLSGLPIQPGQTRAISVTSTAPQGGSLTGCGIPFGKALAVMVNFVAVSPAGPGFLQVWPWSDPATEPDVSSVINYNLNLTVANAIILPTCTITAGPCAQDLFLRAGVSGTDVVADVVGYFTANNLDDARTKIQATLTTAGFPPATLTASCTAPPGGHMSLGTSGPGRHAIVRSTVRIRIDHVQGVDDEVRLCLSQTEADCSACQTAAAAVYRVPAAWPSASGIEVTLPLEQVFPLLVASEVTPFYINGLVPSGSASPDQFISSSSVVEGVPDLDVPN